MAGGQSEAGGGCSGCTTRGKQKGRTLISSALIFYSMKSICILKNSATYCILNLFFELEMRMQTSILLCSIHRLSAPGGEGQVVNSGMCVFSCA